MENVAVHERTYAAQISQRAAGTKKHTPEDALSIYVEANLTVNQYEMIHQANKDPCYTYVQSAKQDCYPPKSVSETVAEVKLQDLLDQTSRLCKYLEPVLQQCIQSTDTDLVLIYQWGCDGSTQSQYKQKFEEDGNSDANIFLGFLAPLRLIQEKEKIKRKGGAEKERERKKKKLLEEAAKCRSLDTFSFFNPQEQPRPSTSKMSEPLKNTPVSTIMQESSPKNKKNIEILRPTLSSEMISQPIVPFEIDKEYCLEPDFFKRPTKEELGFFFEYHPKIPNKNEAHSLPFNVENVFKRSPTEGERKWISFNDKNNSLFCCVCLAFSGINEKNIFTQGMSDWRHVYQRINEHEISNQHTNSVTSYFRFVANKCINKLLCDSEILKKKQSKITQNREVVHRVIDVIKLISKRGLSYRGKTNEAAYTLDSENEHKDHGTFLEIILLLSKYDIVLKNHLDSAIEISKKNEEKGIKNRTGNFVTFISKTTVNMLISIITTDIKKLIFEQIKSSGMFSLELDTTQDISVMDQCSVVVRYVYQKQVMERLVAVVSCHDSTGQGFHDIINNVLQKNDLDVGFCIADSTDGAANMQGKYNGFTVKMQDQNQNHVHIWCYAHILNLVLNDILKDNLQASNLFSLLNTTASFFRESYKRMDIWSSISEDQNRKKLGLIGTTRWWSKEKELVKVFGEEPLYIDHVSSFKLEFLVNDEEFKFAKALNIEQWQPNQSNEENSKSDDNDCKPRPSGDDDSELRQSVDDNRRPRPSENDGKASPSGDDLKPRPSKENDRRQ
ncbi:unnamed protein product [Brassicogethes aeneus]|uniref:TTF-type domain-containing protein n=1 Tax=Brassicogethes aeneus TaxID=1431903 RepID=A0A9P0FC72_BRAAE|nr:unnamed protein product [Brassicogethes aeneus]